MKIVDFTAVHIEEAARITKQNYEEERRVVSSLPPIDAVPDLTPFAANGMGVTALEGDTVAGFLCTSSPFKNAFGSTGVTGVFSPMGTHGVTGENRAAVYARLYEAAGEKWAGAGAASHAVCLYAHDREVQEQFFRYGFGMRCVDAVRGMDEIAASVCEGYTFSELSQEESLEVLPLVNMLQRHCLESPFFMVKSIITEAEFLKGLSSDRYFAAKKGEKIAALLCVRVTGETFICDVPGYIHVNKAFCLPEHRRKGLSQSLLRLAIRTVKADGYKYMGVDFESINPSAYAFWPKYFGVYVYSLVRRIDEGAVGDT